MKIIIRYAIFFASCFVVFMSLSCGGEHHEKSKEYSPPLAELSFQYSVRANMLATISILKTMGIKNIVEIAGGLPFVCRKLSVEKYWLLGASETRNTKDCENIVLKTNKFFDLKAGELDLKDDYAVVALGVDLWSRKLPEDATVLPELVKNAKAVIVEAPIGEYRRWYQAERIKKMARSAGKTSNIDVQISNMTGDDPDIRQLTVLANPDSIKVREDCDANNAKRWEYLWANPNLNIRQGIAAEFIRSRNIKNIVEVGGFCTPICNYYKDATYTNIDPFVHSMKSYECSDANLLQTGVEKIRYSKMKVAKPFAVVMLGLYWEFLKDQDASEVPFVKDSFKDASIVVVETPPSVSFSTRHINQIINYAKSLGFEVALALKINVLGTQPNPYAFYRQMTILERKK